VNEEKIILYLQNGQHERAFTKLYKHFGKVEHHVVSNSGSKDEALDIFQEGLVTLYKKVNSDDFDQNIKIVGFLIQSCKFLWSNELRKKKVRQGSDDTKLGFLEYEDEMEETIEKEEKIQLIEAAIKKLGDKCKQILEAFYFKSISMTIIAEKFGFRSVNSAKAQKYKCMERVRTMVLEEYDAGHNDQRFSSLTDEENLVS
jgi:RNA polymerase sigma factor (sigma-70 family)